MTPAELILIGLLTLVLLVAILTWYAAWNGYRANRERDSYEDRKSRLPAATEFENISERLKLAKAELSERQEELSVVEQKIQDRDRLIAEVSSLQERLDALHVEHAGLSSARADIEEAKKEAASAASELAELSQKLDAARTEHNELERSLEVLRKEREKKPENLERRIEELELRLETLKDERTKLENELDPLREERDTLMRLVHEARRAETEKLALERDIQSLEEGVATLKEQVADHERASAEVARLSGQEATLQESISRLMSREDKLAAKVDELEQEIAEEEPRLEELAQLDEDLSNKRRRAAELADEISSLIARRTQIESDMPSGTSADAGQLLADLKAVPRCLELPESLRASSIRETDALYEVQKYLERLGLRYHWRTVYAFHTSLKINDVAQLTVLSGVSGTGKSMLPRRYAEAMGMHFLPLSVEPRWDSPQDLLGFYNYIEKKYRASELSRALVHMDPHNTSGLSNQDFSDHMLLVLLDEMNLARVEYYFSEFLSRLEARPTFNNEGVLNSRKDSLIPIDVRGVEHGSVNLYPSHNILFAGTMNDDESTQSLSDKVLDRGNILQFAAPTEFSSFDVQRSAEPASEGIRFGEWRSWTKETSSLEAAPAQMARTTISELAQIMEHFGRPFGHRLNDSILSYVANYPKDGPAGSGSKVPLSDQIEFRIMPKLRGVEIDNHQEGFERLESLLRNELADENMADKLKQLREQQSNSTGLFNWRGLSHSGAGNAGN
ncbi:AAA family ATPase [uncultured Roseibium sp.]|uniref:AAA family ATPase n=1 Tax=uncultured Roseibium sp. TaxID=1936171 RepID=UPI002614FBE2|nr:AAA family ATPase [uncultured Roseibium sp.]